MLVRCFVPLFCLVAYFDDCIVISMIAFVLFRCFVALGCSDGSDNCCGYRGNGAVVCTEDRNFGSFRIGDGVVVVIFWW
jgi:hypothetical protein